MKFPSRPIHNLYNLYFHAPKIYSVNSMSIKANIKIIHAFYLFLVDENATFDCA